MGWNIYRAWKEGPWDLPSPSRPTAAETRVDEPIKLTPRPPINTDMIVSKNLFDPERGAGATREAEENSRAFQRLRNIILVGTVIIGNNRTAILQDGSNPNVPAAAPNQTAAPMRLKLGDNIEGFRLSEIGDKRVVFSKDASRIEVLLDYFRKVEVAQPRGPLPPGQVSQPGPVAPVPRVIPNLPRRTRIPTPGSLTPDS
jgi:hypothetical protein